jgi:hypothetical protein
VREEVQQALQEWAKVVNLKFQEVSSTCTC